MVERDLTSIDPADRAAVEAMPKIELHNHLEGSIRPATMLQLAENNGIDIGVDTEDELRATYEFDDFDQFADLFMMGLSVLQTPQDFELVIAELTTELLEQNVLHAELTVTPWNHLNRGVSIEDFAEALNSGRAAAAARGLSIVWIHDIPRGFERPPYELTMDYLLGDNLAGGVVAIGVGGTEVGYPPELFASEFERAIEAGLRSCPHAGETEGATSVRGALDALRAERIGHGIRALEDPQLVAELAERALPLEVSPTSNVALKIVPDYESHPLREMIAAGLNVSINSDDPAYFSTTLTEELLVAIAYAGCSVDDLRTMQRRALDAAFIDESQREQLRARLS